MSDISLRPCTLKELRNSGWRSRSVKHEVQENFVRQLQTGDDLFPGIIGYENTVIPEINIALLSGHDCCFLARRARPRAGSCARWSGSSMMPCRISIFRAAPFTRIRITPSHRQARE